MRSWLPRFPGDSDHRGADNDFAALFDAMAEPAMLLTPEGSIAVANPAFGELLGRAAIPIAAAPLETLFEPAVRSRLSEWIRGGGVGALEARLAVPEGQEPTVLRCRLRRLNGGRWALLAEDLSERDRYRAHAAEGERLRAVGQLAGGVAHDFNNLLSIIVAAAEEVRDAAPPTASGLDPLLMAAGRGADLVRRLLAFAGRQRLEPRVMVLDEMLAGLRPMLRPLLGPAVRLDIRTGAPGRRVLADPSQLEQVVLNLAVNAGQAMPRGGSLVLETDTAMALREEPGQPDPLPPGRWTVLTVTDTGHGIVPEVLSQIFEPFFTTRAGAGGTGLGLATVRGIVRQSGGALQVSSRPGEGTVFRIFLPRHDGEVLPEAVPNAAATGWSDAAPVRILLVDDEAPLRGLVERALCRDGMTVEAAGDAEEALARLEAGFVPDLLVTDLAMPGMDGLSLARSIRSRNSALPVVLVSGYAEASLRGEEVDAGMAFLAKPYRPAQLSALVRRMLALSRSGAEPA